MTNETAQQATSELNAGLGDEGHEHKYSYHDTVCKVSGLHPAYCLEDHLRCPRIDTCSICGHKRIDA